MKSIFVSLTILSAAYHAEPAMGCHNQEVSIYFGNGMFNSRDDAHKSKFALQRELRQSGISQTEVQIAYNLNEPALEELLQVASQKDEEYGRMFWRYLSNLSLAPEAFRQLARDISRKFDQNRYVLDPDLRNHVAAYRSEIKNGKSVLIIAHSQGNFYANAAWNILNDETGAASKVSIVGVAAPVREIAGDGPYTTLTQDIIIATVRGLAETLPANVTNSKSSLSGHEFISQYLAGDHSGPKIIADIRQSIQEQLKNVTTTPTDLSDSGYVHPSLIPFWQYVARARAHSNKLNDAECLAISSFAKTYDWWGETCEKRSLTALTAWMSDCFKQWSEKDRFEFGSCSLLGDGSFIDAGLESSRVFDFILASHPECIWHGAQVRQHVTPEILSQAQALLRSSSSSQ
jgi:hypothetical protein